MAKLTASQDISQFLASANKVEARGVLETIETEDLIGITLVTAADDTVKGYVGDIGSNAFQYESTLKGLSLGSSVTDIGDYAFYGCSGFTGSLTIPNSVTSIGSYAFYYCSGFTGSLTIPNSVTSIDGGAFASCSGFTGSLTIPNSVTSIGNYAFQSCSSLISVTIGNSVTSIGSYAFQYCSALTSVTIPDSVTSINNYAFKGCTSLDTLNCNVTRTIINQTDVLLGCLTPFTLHARASDSTWTAGADTIGGLSVTVVKDL